MSPQSILGRANRLRTIRVVRSELLVQRAFLCRECVGCAHNMIVRTRTDRDRYLDTYNFGTQGVYRSQAATETSFVWQETIQNVERGSREELMLRMTLRIVDQWTVPGPSAPNGRLAKMLFRCCLLVCFFATLCDRRQISNLLMKARIQAWRLILAVAFPLIKTGVRDVWVVFQTLVLIVTFSMEVATISNRLDTHKALTSVGLTLSTLALVLSVVDVVLDFIRRCRRYYRNVKGWSETFLHRMFTRALPQSSQAEVTNDNSTSNQRDQVHGDDGNAETDNSETDQHADQDEQNSETSMCCRKFVDGFRKYGDPIRSVVSELIIYPLLIIALFQFITGEGYNPQNAVERFGLGLFCLNVVYLILGVYVVRIIMVGGFLVTVSKVPTPNFTSSRLYSMFLFTHVLGQMMSQIVSLTNIGIQIYRENLGSDSLRISWQLGLIIAGAFVLPIFGVLMFFVTTFHWADDFSLGLLLGLLKLLKAKKFPNMVFEAEGVDDQKRKELARKLTEEVRYDELIEEYNQFNGSYHIFYILSYPYRNPIAVGLSIIYILLLSGYIYCNVTAPNAILAMPIINIVILSICNFYTIQIACYWISQPFWCVFTAVIVIIFGILINYINMVTFTIGGIICVIAVIVIIAMAL